MKVKSKGKNMSNKMIVYGCTGFGKSYTIISNILKTRKKVVILTENGATDELRFMDIEDTDIKIVEPADICNFDKTITPLTCPGAERETVFQDLSSRLINAGITSDESYTVIIIGYATCLYDEPTVRMISNWKCSVVIEYCGRAALVEENEIPDIMNSAAWEKYPLYNSLRPGVPKTIPEIAFVSGKDAEKYSKGLQRICKTDNLKIEPRRLFGEDGYFIKFSRSYVSVTAGEQMKMFNEMQDLLNKCTMIRYREL